MDSLTTSLLRLAGYGGFAISATPFFSPVILTFMKTYNAILAVPNIRGGGEFGGEWHRAGNRENKVCVHCLIFPVESGTLSNRGTLLIVSSVLRMSATILLS
jgi:hypothetical protein